MWRLQKELYALEATKCVDCSLLFFPAREICRECGNSKLMKQQLKGAGIITSFTIIRTDHYDQSQDQVEHPARLIPYVLALVTMDEGPTITAEIVDAQHNDIAIGKRVEMIFRRLHVQGEKGVIQYGYKARLIHE